MATGLPDCRASMAIEKRGAGRPCLLDWRPLVVAAERDVDHPRRRLRPPRQRVISTRGPGPWAEVDHTCHIATQAATTNAVRRLVDCILIC